MRLILFVLAGLSSALLSAQDSLNMSKLGQLQYPMGLNDIWGYEDGSGNEYALVGTINGFSIVDVTAPSNPVEKHFIPGVSSTWRDIKTFGHYAYVVHDLFSGGSNLSSGILIVDMDSVNEANIKFKNYFPGDSLFGAPMNFLRAHNIYIDENGILHVYGSNVSNGGALFFDLNNDPENPEFVGIYDEKYLHDGMGRGDTLWGGAIFTGELVAVDISDRANPKELGQILTPDAFTHNCWVSDDGKTVFTTDEVSGAYVAAYDVSDISNISETDRIQTSIGTGNVIPHNAHVYGDFVVTSYYTSGVQIVDATLPNVMVETAFYDTSPFTGNTFQGAWGAYPYLPSKNVLVTDREQGLFILDTDYPKACYLTGLVKDSLSGVGIPNANIEILTTTTAPQADILGNYATAILNPGSFQVVYSKPGYTSDTLSLNFSRGVELKETVALLPVGFSLEENGAEKFSISPNPGTSFFNIEFGDNITGGVSSLKIVSMNGQLVKEQLIDLANKKYRIDHSLKPGTYSIFIENKDFQFQPVQLLVIE